MPPQRPSGTGEGGWDLWSTLLALVAAASLFRQLSTGAPPRVVPLTIGPRNVLTFAQVLAFALQAGFPAGDVANTAAAIAMAESAGNPAAVGDGGASLGLWQIHVPSHPEVDATRLSDPVYAAQAAFLVSKGGSDWGAWTMFRNGQYKRFLPAA